MLGGKLGIGVGSKTVKIPNLISWCFKMRVFTHKMHDKSLERNYDRVLCEPQAFFCGKKWMSGTRETFILIESLNKVFFYGKQVNIPSKFVFLFVG